MASTSRPGRHCGTTDFANERLEMESGKAHGRAPALRAIYSIKGRVEKLGGSWEDDREEGQEPSEAEEEEGSDFGEGEELAERRPRRQASASSGEEAAAAEDGKGWKKV